MSAMPPPPPEPTSPSNPPPPPSGQTMPPPPPAFTPAPPSYAPVAAGSVHLGPTLPPGITIVTPGARLLSYLLQIVLVFVTLVIGWLIWAAIIAGNGQSPAKQLMGQRVIRSDGSGPVGFGTMLFMRGIIGGIVAQFAIFFTFGILLFMPFWDRRNQNIWDKVSSTIVVRDPNNAWGLN